jgi:SIR2-like domain
MNLAELPKVCVVVGAGASFDAWNGVSNRRDGWRPPLATELFGRRLLFEPILSRYPGADQLGQEIARLAAEGAFSLEQQLRRYASHADARVQAQFREVPAYLRDVISATRLNYLGGASVHAVFVRKLLADAPHHVAFLIMNYDDYIERALSGLDTELFFGSIDDYVRPDRQAIVVKPHGSIDWLVDLGAPSQPWETTIAAKKEIPLTSIFVQSPTLVPLATVPYDFERINRRVVPVADVRVAGNLVYPVLTAPLAGKGDKDVVCPPPHIERFRDFVRDCTKFLFVGTSGLDEDIMELLHSSVTRVLIVEHVGDTAVKDSRDRFANAVPPLGSAPHNSVYSDGFQQYVFSGEFERFLTWQPPNPFAAGAWPPSAPT